MIVDYDMIQIKTKSVAPVPTVLPEPTVHYIKAGDVGNRTLWVVCVIMALSSLAFYGMAFRVPVSKRLFHTLTAFITTFAFLSYFAMATGDGINYNKTVKSISHKHGLPDTEEVTYRQVYWARYVDWSITTPLILLDLCLLAGLSGANILVAIVADLIMILSGLFAAYGRSDGQKWGWYAWACIAYLTIVYQVVINGRTAAATKDSKTKALFASLVGYAFTVWTVYLIIWGITDGSKIINLDTEIVVYAVLDVLAKPVFGFWLLFAHDSMSSTTPSLEGFWSKGWGNEGSIRVGED